jgi:hypothetical protein
MMRRKKQTRTMDRNDDFPGPVQGDLWSWTEVEAYLNRKGLPRQRHPAADGDAAGRDERILAALRLYPDGLTKRQLADLLAADETASTRGEPTYHGILVRIEDRLRRLKAAGKVTSTPGITVRSGVIWRLP